VTCEEASREGFGLRKGKNFYTKALKEVEMFTRSLDEINEMRRSFDQLFESFFNATPRRASGQTASSDWVFAPAVESGWTDDYLNLRVVIPGVTEKDMKVTVQGNQLYISGERKAPENFGKEGYVWNQIPYGKFERVLDLPAGLDLDKLQAHLHDGLLDIRIPVASAMKPKQIQITAAEPKEIAA
jgi:HSP20 family protein